MFKAGTLPLNMYVAPNAPNEGITLEEFEGGDEANPETNSEAANSEEVDQECREEEVEQEEEYDTDSDNDVPATLDRDDEETTFLHATTTRSGRTVRVSSRLYY